MKDLVLHPLTRQQLEAFITAPAHALMLVGPTGSGKRTVAIAVAKRVLELHDSQVEEYPYTLMLKPELGKALGIEVVRQIEQFLALKVPSQAAFDRAVIIEDAHMLTREAQNALLKNLEEPPSGTIFILTVNHAYGVLPTIRSRAQSISLGHLERDVLEAHFASWDYSPQSISQAYAISGGLPGLMCALLSEAEHPLLLATVKARQILGQTNYQRLLLVDELSKQRALAADTVFIMQQMAHVSLQKARGTPAQKWKNVLRVSYEANEALSNSAQPKLALTKLMLSL